MVELADPGPGLGLLREALRDAGVGEPVQRTELPLTQPLVADDLDVDVRVLDGELGGAPGSHVRRREHDRRAPLRLGQPRPEGPSLLLTELGQIHVHVAFRDLDLRDTGALGRVPGHVPGALSVAGDQEQLGPAGVVGHGPTSTLTSPRAHGGSSTSWSCRAQPPRCLAWRMRAPKVSSSASTPRRRAQGGGSAPRPARGRPRAGAAPRRTPPAAGPRGPSGGRSAA